MGQSSRQWWREVPLRRHQLLHGGPLLPRRQLRLRRGGQPGGTVRSQARGVHVPAPGGLRLRRADVLQPLPGVLAGVNIKKNEPCHVNSKLGDQCFFEDEGFCGDGLFCKIRDYYCKYEPNPTGVCRKEPADTACTMEYAPVCGCDCNT